MTNEERFRQSYADHYRNVLAFALSRVGGRSSAEDVVGEVFTVAWRRVDAMPDEPETRLWLFGIARNVLRNAQRSGQRRLRLAAKLRSLPDVHVESAEASVELPDEEIDAALGELSDADRDVLVMSVWDELTVADIAVLMDISPNAVRIRLHRARRRLAAALDATVPKKPSDTMKSPDESGHDPVSTTTDQKGPTA